jgi:hypothetical protein
MEVLIESFQARKSFNCKTSGLLLRSEAVKRSGFCAIFAVATGEMQDKTSKYPENYQNVVVSPHRGMSQLFRRRKNRKNPREYDKEKYKRQNVVERLFRRLKEFRKVCTRYDKADVMFLALIQFAFVIIWLNLRQHALVLQPATQKARQHGAVKVIGKQNAGHG